MASAAAISSLPSSAAMLDNLLAREKLAARFGNAVF
jgi:hypothetical protein